MTALQITQEEIGSFDYEAAKARKARMWAAPKPAIRPVVVQLLTKRPPHELDLEMYEFPIGPIIPKRRHDQQRLTTLDRIRLEAQVMNGTKWLALVALACLTHDVSRAQLFSQQRSAWLARIRHELWWTALKLTDLSSTQMGRLSGDRDHTTVLHGQVRYQRFVDEGTASTDLLIKARALPLFQEAEE